MFRKPHLLLLIRYLRPQMPRVWLMTGLLVSSIAFNAVGPRVLGKFIDLVSQQAKQAALVRTALLFLSVTLAGQAFSAMSAYTSTQVAWEATNRLRADLARYCLRLDMRFHHAHAPGEMIQRIDGDVGILGNFFSQFAVQVAANAVLVVVIMVLIFIGYFWAGMILAAYVTAAFAVLLYEQRIERDTFSRSRAVQAQAVGFWEEMLTAREDVKPLGGLEYILRRNVDHQRAMFRIGRQSTVLFRAYAVTFTAVFVIGNAIAFGMGAYLFGQGRMTIGDVFLLLAYTNLLATRVGNIANQSNDFQQALVAIQRVSELSETVNPLRDGPGARLDNPAPAVEFQEVSFAYTSETPVLHSLSFHLEGGQRLGLLGRTGSGKSTIVRLMFRFYDPDQGAIRLDGTDLRQPRLDELRRTIGMVTQEVQLFNASVRDNLTLFDENIPGERVVQALEELGLGAWLGSLPAGIDTLISGDAGLSAGEAQLLALARVFLQDPRLVILDEASSRLDPATEARLERAVDRLLRGRTAIVIAHRLNTLRKVDQLLVLEGGRRIEYGSREGLAAQPGSEYNRLLHLGMAALE